MSEIQTLYTFIITLSVYINHIFKKSYILQIFSRFFKGCKVRESKRENRTEVDLHNRC